MNLLRLGDTHNRPTLQLIYKSTLECKARLKEYMNDDDFEDNEYATAFFLNLSKTIKMNCALTLQWQHLLSTLNRGLRAHSPQ